MRISRKRVQRQREMLGEPEDPDATLGGDLQIVRGRARRVPASPGVDVRVYHDITNGTETVGLRPLPGTSWLLLAM